MVPFANPGMAGGGAGFYNPSDKSANLDLTQNNTKATGGASIAGPSNVRTINSKTVGKVHVEHLAAGTMSLGSDAFGLALSSMDLNNNLGNSGAAVSLNAGGQIQVAGGIIVNTNSNISFTGADLLVMEADLAAFLVWFRRIRAGVPSDWNNNSGASPATGIGGISFSVLGANPYFAACGLHLTSQSFLTNFGGSPWAATPSAGFGPWSI